MAVVVAEVRMEEVAKVALALISAHTLRRLESKKVTSGRSALTFCLHQHLSTMKHKSANSAKSGCPALSKKMHFGEG